MSSLKRLQINTTNWEELARDRPTWRRTVKTGAAIHEANCIAAAKAKSEARKSQLRPITREDTKFHYVMAALPMDIATDLRDIIDCPSTEAPYTALKEALISRISLSTQKRLQRLISEEDLGGRKPTQLLRCLEKLADGQKLDTTMFKQLFLQRLPPSVQAILAPNIPSSTVQMLAETANRILEYYQPPVTVNVASRSTTAPTIENVVKRLDALTLEVSQLRATRVYNLRSPAISRCPRSPTRNQPTVEGTVAPEVVPKTAITTPFGLFEFVRMPFGLRNSAQTFQRFINEALRDLPFIFVYVDDIPIASSNEHKQY
nr:unnamed protein product [Spirometra erinaceieuropaei]